MALILDVDGVIPKIGKNSWVADNATLTGDVHIGEDCSIWFQVVIRGDCNKIRIGNACNIQDGAIVHGTVGRWDTILKDRVSVGHKAIIHGCQIESDVLVGMGAIILDDVLVPSNTIIAAGAVVTSGTKLESGYIYAGTPARKLKAIDEKNAQIYIKGTAQAYMKYKEYYNK